MCTQIYLRFHICPCELRYRLDECEYGRLDPRCKHVHTSTKWTHRDYCHYHMSVRAAARAKAKARAQRQAQDPHRHDYEESWGPAAGTVPATPAARWASHSAATLGAAEPWGGGGGRVFSEPWFAKKPKPKRQSSWWWRDGPAADGRPFLARPLLTAAAADTRRFS